MRRPWINLAPAAILLGTLLTVRPTVAQETRRYTPLDHRQPAGVAARWHAITQPGVSGHTQPVRVELPSQGLVTYFDGSSPEGTGTATPSQAGLLVGHVYRIKVSDMPEFPGLELYPTIELLDRLHPPAGLADEFPIPVPLTVEEIEIALADRMVTKVIYLEQPRLAAPFVAENGQHVTELSGTSNLMDTAYRLGRPMALVRIGGRTPAPGDEFLSAPAPIDLTAASAK